MQDLSDILDVRDLGKLTQILDDTLRQTAKEWNVMLAHHIRLGGKPHTGQLGVTYDFGTRGLMVLRGDLA